MNLFHIQYSDQPVTPWGGLAIVKRALDTLGFNSFLKSLPLPQPRSNRGTDPVQLIEQWIVSIWCGACRFVHADNIRFDHTITRLFGWSKPAGHRAITRLFERFTQEDNTLIGHKMFSWFFAQTLPLSTITVDVDSTIITRYGKQQGTAQGYNPKKKGYSAHHPLMAFIAEARMVANFWLRPGNAHSANNVLAFLSDTQKRLGSKRIGLLRADSGFYDEDFLHELEAQSIDYIVAAKLTHRLQREITLIKDWWALEEGIELSEIVYQAQGWSQARRMVVIRQKWRREGVPGKALSLFGEEESGYRYGVLVTNVKRSVAGVWREYRGRADCENRIKELKADFGLETICLKNFWATESALNMAMMAYNLMSMFRQAVMRSGVQHTLSTLHGKVLAIAGHWHRDKSRSVLLLSVPRKRRDWFNGLWSSANSPPVIPVCVKNF